MVPPPLMRGALHNPRFFVAIAPQNDKMAQYYHAELVYLTFEFLPRRGVDCFYGIHNPTLPWPLPMKGGERLEARNWKKSAKMPNNP